MCVSYSALLTNYPSSVHICIGYVYVRTHYPSTCELFFSVHTIFELCHTIYIVLQHTEVSLGLYLIRPSGTRFTILPRILYSLRFISLQPIMYIQKFCIHFCFSIHEYCHKRGENVNCPLGCLRRIISRFCYCF